MGVRVDENLERMREGLRTGDPLLADLAFEADNEIDAMNVSLTERCYLLLGREAPVASDLRFVVSVLRIVSELERIGDLALRVVKLSPKHELLHAVRGRSSTSWSPWPTRPSRCTAWRCGPGPRRTFASPELATQNRNLDLYYERLMGELKRLDGPDAVADRDGRFTAGRALERIADHSAIIGARLRYLITGEPAHLAAEVR